MTETREISEKWDIERTRDYSMVISILTEALMHREQISDENINVVHTVMGLTAEHYYCEEHTESE
jgi:hypothetical protein